MQTKWSDKTILVTGATSGIGYKTAILLDSKGCRLVLTGRDGDRMDALLKELIGKEHLSFCADLNSKGELENLIDFCPAFDGIVFSAGIVKPKPIKFIDSNDIDAVLGTNLISNILLTAGLFKRKKINKQASLVYLSSISAQYPYFGGALYSSSKAGLESFSKTVALEYANQKIRANSIAPALVETPILDASKKINTSNTAEEYEKKYPLGYGKPQDVANMILFLLSDESNWITGQNYVMDGGFLLNAK